ncbi:MAG TPA: Uma2 family endonuclease [Candidatus Tyrphobacter sp.]
MNAASNPSTSMALPLAHRRFSLSEYEAMVEHGILTPDDRAELLSGEIVEKMTIGSRHAACVSRLECAFRKALGDRILLRTASPVALPPNSEPEPDVALLRPREDFYAAKHPRATDVFLVIEVADSSLWVDRTIKLELYAAAGIPEYWIVDLTSNAIEIYTAPRGGAYSRKSIASSDEAIALVAFPDFALCAANVIP